MGTILGIVIGLIVTCFVGMLLYGVVKLGYELVCDSLIGTAFIPCMVICALIICAGIFFAIKGYIILLILILAVTLPFCSFVVFVRARENKVHVVVARCEGMDFGVSYTGHDASASVSLSKNSIGSGYSGELHYTPSTRHANISYNVIFRFPNYKKIHLPHDDKEIKFNNKYGVLSYTRSGWYKFEPFENQEEGKAKFESQKRK